MDGHEKIKMIGTEKPMDHNDWLRRIAANHLWNSLSQLADGKNAECNTARQTVHGILLPHQMVASAELEGGPR